MSSIIVAEILGTMFLILLGNGVVANVVLKGTKGNGSGWIVITTGWALAVFVGVVIAGPHSGAHLNPAVTIGLAVAGKLSWSLVPQYLIGEIIGTFALVFVIFYIAGPELELASDSGAVIGLGSMGALPVAFLVWVIGLSLGGTTGYAINPARDLGPRIMHTILPVKGSSDWGYSWIPIVGPIIGAVLAAVLYGALI